MIDYHQIIVDFLNGTIPNTRALAKAIGGHPLYPERPPGDYKAARRMKSPPKRAGETPRCSRL